MLTDGDGQGSESWEELISERIFGQEIPPRWVLAVSRDQLLLIDRQKWAASRLLRFELGTLLGELARHEFGPEAGDRARCNSDLNGISSWRSKSSAS